MPAVRNVADWFRHVTHSPIRCGSSHLRVGLRRPTHRRYSPVVRSRAEHPDAAPADHGLATAPFRTAFSIRHGRCRNRRRRNGCGTRPHVPSVVGRSPGPGSGHRHRHSRDVHDHPGTFAALKSRVADAQCVTRNGSTCAGRGQCVPLRRPRKQACAEC